MPHLSTSENKNVSGFSLKYWRHDLVAAFSVAMVALPLGLGIAQAVGFPPVSGVISAIVAGLVATFIRGSHIAINGPGAGLISVLIAASVAMSDGAESPYRYVLAMFVMVGIIQILLGLLKLGKIGEMFPSSVIHGVLAAIGIIIFSKQVPVALGTFSDATAPLDILQEIPTMLGRLQPVIAIIALIGIVLLIGYPKIKIRTLQFIPAPMWVLVIAFGLVYLFRAIEPGLESVLGAGLPQDSSFFIEVPDDLFSSLVFPDFSRIGEFKFWLGVIPITMMASIETLASAKAIDKLDPYKRQTNLNQELFATGAATVLSALVGGLPVMTVIVRSSVNIQNQARTSASNFFHGLILLLLVVLLTPLIQQIPLAALAAILIHTGYKLASPTVFRQSAQTGAEQVIIVVVTLVSTLLTNLLWGLFIGTLFTLFVHWLRVGLPLPSFLFYIRKAHWNKKTTEGQPIQYRVKGILNFLNYLTILNDMKGERRDQKMQLDLSRTRLVDVTSLEAFATHNRLMEARGGYLEIIGLGSHQRTALHPVAMRVLQTELRKPFTKRQSDLEHLAHDKGWSYIRDMNWEVSSLNEFDFFQSRPIEYKENVTSCRETDLGISWEIADVIFDEGALIATEVFHTTLEVVRLPTTIPEFTLSREGRLDQMFDRVRVLTGRVDIDFPAHPEFSRKYFLEGKNPQAIHDFFNSSLIKFLEKRAIYHIESNGKSLLLFRRLRLAKPEEISVMAGFCHDFVQTLNLPPIPDQAISPVG